MSVNKAILIGNLGKDPEIRNFNGGTVANVSVATTKKWKDKSGAKQERTEWHNVVFFGPLAGVVEKWLHKGAKVYVEGELQTSKYVKNGVDTWTTKVIGNNLVMLGGAKSKPAMAPVSNQSQPQNTQQSYGASNYNEPEEDMPF